MTCQISGRALLDSGGDLLHLLRALVGPENLLDQVSGDQQREYGDERDHDHHGQISARQGDLLTAFSGEVDP